MQTNFYTAKQTGERVLLLTLALQDGKVVRTFGDEALSQYVTSRRYGQNPGQIEAAVGVDDGKKCLRYLPRNFTGHRLFAEFSLQ